MKKARTIFALLLSLVFVLTACSGGTKSGSTQKAATGSQQPAASPAGSNEKIQLRAAWWGGNFRHEKFNKVFDLYEQRNPNVKILREYTDFATYFANLSTQAAGGNAPDLIGNTMMNALEYINRGVMMPLDDFVEKGTIDLKDWNQGIIDTGKHKDKLYMIASGVTAVMINVNVDMIKRVGMKVPQEDMDYDEFYNFCVELQSKLPKGVWAVQDINFDTYDHPLETFMRQKGTGVFTEDGKLAFKKKDLEEYLNYWDKMRQAGVVPPANVMSERGRAPQEDSMIVKGQVAMMINNSNQTKARQSYMKDKLGIIRLPILKGARNPHGEAMQPSSFGISSKSKHPEEAAKLINFFVNDPDANRILKADWGTPGNTKIYQMLVDEKLLEKGDDLSLEHMKKVSESVPPTKLRVTGSQNVFKAYLDEYEQIMFKKKTVTQAVDDFFTAAAKALR